MEKNLKFDIREYKTKLRNEFKSIRHEFTYEDKLKKDMLIFNRIISSKVFEECTCVLTYVSTPIEVDTHMLIKYSLSQNKTVAVPRCISGTRDMKFYIIASMDDLESGSFSVLEPKVEICKEYTDFENAICIVPGLAFDVEGYRLGYGKGYYDRFLDKIGFIKKIGIEYCACTVSKLYRGKYDLPVDILITEKYFRFLGGKNGHGQR